MVAARPPCTWIWRGRADNSPKRAPRSRGWRPGSVIVQQQALRDPHPAWPSFFAALREWRRRYARTAPDERPDPPGRPSWRKRGRNEGFRVVATGRQDVRRLNRWWAQVVVPKLGWVRYRRSRPVRGEVLPGDPRRRRPLAHCVLRRSRAHRWSRAMGDRGDGPGGDCYGGAVGRGAVSRPRPDRGARRLQGRLQRAWPARALGGNRRGKVKARLARRTSRNADAPPGLGREGGPKQIARV